MKKIVATILGLLLILYFNHGYAQTINQTDFLKLKDTLVMLIKEKMQKDHLVGVGVGLIAGDLAWKAGYGYADKEKKIPFTSHTALCVGSITKPITAMALMQLQEMGKIDINNPLIKYLPEFSIKTRNTKVEDITVKSVMQHTSGIPNDIFLNAWNKDEDYTNVVDYMRNEYACYPVNMSFLYSNVGYSLLGHVIKKISKKSYPEYIRSNILKPVGMKNSGFWKYNMPAFASKTYDSSGIYTTLQFGRNSPAGGLVSSIDDMLLLAKEIIAIYNGKKGGFLSPKTLENFNYPIHDNIQGINTCMGWSIIRNDTTLVIMHSGSHHTANAGITIDLKKRIAAVFLVNTQGGGNLIDEGYSKIWELTGINTADFILPVEYKNSSAKKMPADSLISHIGLYIDGGNQRQVMMENDKLILSAEFGKYLLQPATSNEFIPGIIHKPDSIQWLNKSRFIFENINGYQLLFWQDSKYRRQLLGSAENPKEISDIWHERLGKYLLVDRIESAEKILGAELSIAPNKLLRIEITYTSGNYSYFARIEDKNELIFCGLDQNQGGTTIQFDKDDKGDFFRLFGIKFRKQI